MVYLGEADCGKDVYLCEMQERNKDGQMQVWLIRGFFQKASDQTD